MLASDEFPSYAYKEKDSLIFRLEVPCTDTKIILSEIPNSTKNQVIYGLVEFKSGDYYASSGSVDGQEILQTVEVYYRDVFSGLALINKGGTYAWDSVKAMSPLPVEK